MAAHPLTRPASWTLTVGAPDMWLVRWAGGALWLAGALLSCAWLVALIADGLAGQVHPGAVLLAVPAVLAWLVLAWRIWRRWSSRAQALTLEWHGPVTLEQGSRRASGGFHIGQWRTPVSVRVALSWQGWLLLRVSPVRADAEVVPTYAWLDAREFEAPQATSRNTSLHQLRTLLHLPSAMTTQEAGESAEERAQGAQGRQQVASWPKAFNPGYKLRRLASSIRSDRRSGVATSSRLDTGFPVTTVMAEPQAARRAARVRGGGQG